VSKGVDWPVNNELRGGQGMAKVLSWGGETLLGELLDLLLGGGFFSLSH